MNRKIYPANERGVLPDCFFHFPPVFFAQSSIPIPQSLFLLAIGLGLEQQLFGNLLVKAIGQHRISLIG